jgi:hypothetical protein
MAKEGEPVSGLLSAPKYPTPAAAPAAPTVTNSQPDMDVAARQQALAMQRGRSATLMTGGAGLSDMGTTSRILLGA